MESRAQSIGLPGYPDHVGFSCSTLCKAQPVEEGGRRLIMVEASSEDRDFDGEVVLVKALQASRETFLKFGVLDIDHNSMPSVARKRGITDPEAWIIGQPTEVSFRDATTMVKAELRRGDSALAHRAGVVWDGLTKVKPPVRYYASVGGKVTATETRIDPASGDKVPVISGTHWNNLALSLNPVNPGLNHAVPLGIFHKSLGGLTVSGYGTDSAALVGGGALQRQSLQGHVLTTYSDFRESLARLIRRGGVRASDRGALMSAASDLGVPAYAAGAFVERFLNDLSVRKKTHGN